MSEPTLKVELTEEKRQAKNRKTLLLFVICMIGSFIVGFTLHGNVGIEIVSSLFVLIGFVSIVIWGVKVTKWLSRNKPCDPAESARRRQGKI